MRVVYPEVPGVVHAIVICEDELAVAVTPVGVGGAAYTVTVVVAVVPPQLMVYVFVPVELGVAVPLPSAARVPDGGTPPAVAVIVQLAALDDVQVSVVESPRVIFVGAAENESTEAAAAGFTVTLTLLVALPQVSVYVFVPTLVGVTEVLPSAARLPPGAPSPERVQLAAFVDVHVSVDEPPSVIVAGERVNESIVGVGPDAVQV